MIIGISMEPDEDSTSDKIANQSTDVLDNVKQNENGACTLENSVKKEDGTLHTVKQGEDGTSNNLEDKVEDASDKGTSRSDKVEENDGDVAVSKMEETDDDTEEKMRIEKQIQRLETELNELTQELALMQTAAHPQESSKELGNAIKEASEPLRDPLNNEFATQYRGGTDPGCGPVEFLLTGFLYCCCGCYIQSCE